MEKYGVKGNKKRHYVAHYPFKNNPLLSSLAAEAQCTRTPAECPHHTLLLAAAAAAVVELAEPDKRCLRLPVVASTTRSGSRA